jgi:hypothetical protein
VQEALMRLPRPGENLYLRLNAEEVETWKKIVEDPGLPFNCTILIDADVNPGHAYVEVSGARIDVGLQARVALVRAALGLDRDTAEQELYGESHDDATSMSTINANVLADEVEFEDIEDADHLQEGDSISPDDEVRPE